MRVITPSAVAMQAQRSQNNPQSEGIIRRSWHAALSPFSSTALQTLPDTSQRNRDRAPRADRIPDTTDNESGRETVARDYQAINHSAPPPISVRVPNKIPTTIKVEGKVWFANERTWLAYLNMGVLLGTLALALFNASEDVVARNFGVFYAAVSIGVLIYGWVVYQKRITMIRRRDPGHFDQIAGPIVISAFLFFAILTNFIIRVQELRRKAVPIPED